MTPEREAEIRAVLNGDQSVGLDEALIVMSKAADDLLDEVDRIQAGIKALTRVGYDHTPDCVKEQEQARHAGESFWHPDCGRCWEDSLHNLLDPTEGETDER